MNKGIIAMIAFMAILVLGNSKAPAPPCNENVWTASIHDFTTKEMITVELDMSHGWIEPHSDGKKVHIHLWVEDRNSKELMLVILPIGEFYFGSNKEMKRGSGGAETDL